MHPSTRGAEYLYRTVLRAHFLRASIVVDAFVADVSGAGGVGAAAARLMGGGGGAAAAAAPGAAATVRAVSATGSVAVLRGTGAAPPPDPSLIFGEAGGAHSD
jgi:hypothetical protein